jgi:hypothetical protein
MTIDNRRQITDVGAMLEVVPPKRREITDVGVSVEIAQGRYRQITDVGVLVELVPSIERPGDYGWVEKQFYLEKLRDLNDNHGRHADLSPYEGSISPDQLAALKRLYVDELLATNVMAPIAFLLRSILD